MPLLGKVIAHGLVVRTHRGQFDSGVGEVEVGMFQFVEHGLRRGLTVIQK